MGGAVLGEAEREEGDVVVTGAFEEVVPEGGGVRRERGIWGVVGSCEKAADFLGANHQRFGGGEGEQAKVEDVRVQWGEGIKCS